jgi:hypothetical protein
VTTAEKILQTIAEISEPGDDAGGLELAFASVAMMMGRALPDAIAEMSGRELDDTVLGLARWFANIRGDQSTRLLVVELPRTQGYRDTPAGTKLHQMDLAEKIEVPAGLPL